VQHSEDLPRPDCVYRCPICRLQMKFDPVQKKMKPIPPNGDNGAKTRRSPNASPDDQNSRCPMRT
jgi:hypothetical protein